METNMHGPWTSIQQVMRANAAINGHWFDNGTMSFFNSHVEDQGKIYGGRWFISSEQFVYRGERYPRKYTIRRVEDDGSVLTAAMSWQQYDSIIAARAAVEVMVSSAIKAQS